MLKRTKEIIWKVTETIFGIVLFVVLLGLVAIALPIIGTSLAGIVLIVFILAGILLVLSIPWVILLAYYEEKKEKEK